MTLRAAGDAPPIVLSELSTRTSVARPVVRISEHVAFDHVSVTRDQTDTPQIAAMEGESSHRRAAGGDRRPVNGLELARTSTTIRTTALLPASGPLVFGLAPGWLYPSMTTGSVISGSVSG